MAASRSHLVATPVTDRNGKQTTVFKKPHGPGSGKSAVPAPSVSGQKPPAVVRTDAYAERLAAVEPANAAYRADPARRLGFAEAAGEGMRTLTLAVARGHRSQAEDLAHSIGAAFEDDAYSRIIIADNFGHLYSGLEASNGVDLDLTDTERMLDVEQKASADAADYNAVFVIAEALQNVQLMSLSEIPGSLWDNSQKPVEERDLRFLAHLYASAESAIDYGDRKSDWDVVRLIDEYPDRVKEIIAARKEEGLHAAAIKAQILGEGASALRTGTL